MKCKYCGRPITRQNCVPFYSFRNLDKQLRVLYSFDCKCMKTLTLTEEEFKELKE